MNTPRPLIDAPATAAWLAPYREGLARRELRLPRCAVCGAWDWYPSAATSSCHHAPLHWQAIAPGAEVFTFTRVERPLLSGVDQSYDVGLVCPDDAPACRIATRLVAWGGDIAIGRRARLAFSAEGGSVFPYYMVEVSA